MLEPRTRPMSTSAPGRAVLANTGHPRRALLRFAARSPSGDGAVGGSSTAEHSAVNRRVVGSNPTPRVTESPASAGLSLFSDSNLASDLCTAASREPDRVPERATSGGVRWPFALLLRSGSRARSTAGEAAARQATAAAPVRRDSGPLSSRWQSRRVTGVDDVRLSARWQARLERLLTASVEEGCRFSSKRKQDGLAGSHIAPINDTGHAPLRADV
jgi:hypothetical protein